MEMGSDRLHLLLQILDIEEHIIGLIWFDNFRRINSRPRRRRWVPHTRRGGRLTRGRVLLQKKLLAKNHGTYRYVVVNLALTASTIGPAGAAREELGSVLWRAIRPTRRE